MLPLVNTFDDIAFGLILKNKMAAIAIFIPVNNVEGGYRNSPHPSFRPSVRKYSQSHNFSPILTKFVHHVYITENFYNIYFHKKVRKFVAVASVFLFKLAYVSSLHKNMRVTSHHTFTIPS